jgi:hypothetical protein
MSDEAKFYLEKGEVSNEARFYLEKGEVAVVKRVVPGRLVYVTKKGALDDSVFGFKLNHLIIREKDGSCRPYRGEPLSDLGIKSGSQVNIGETSDEDGEPTLVVALEPRKHFPVGFATAISTAVANTIGATIGRRR